MNQAGQDILLVTQNILLAGQSVCRVGSDGANRLALSGRRGLFSTLGRCLDEFYSTRSRPPGIVRPYKLLSSRGVSRRCHSICAILFNSEEMQSQWNDMFREAKLPGDGVYC